VRDRDALSRTLRAHPPDARGWLRGVGYHESVAGELDRAALDAIVATRPVRVQHRTGQLWMLNTAALEALDLASSHPDGRLYRADRLLRERLGATPPCLARVSRLLWERGVTGVTDATHTNGPAELALFAAARARGELRQDVIAMGTLALSDVEPPPGIAIGPVKIHLAEAELPPLDAVVATIRAAHECGRNAAIHAVTRVELVFALAAYEAAGVREGDRLEHVHVAPPECVAEIARRGLTVCTSAALVAARRSDWAREAAPDDRAWLGRIDLLEAAGVPLCFGSDAPFGPLAAGRPQGPFGFATNSATASTSAGTIGSEGSV
jgi:predicted amidohydrolase YtcJ